MVDVYYKIKSTYSGAPDRPTKEVNGSKSPRSVLSRPAGIYSTTNLQRRGVW